MKVVFLGTGTSTGIPLIGCSCPVCQSMDAKDKRTRTSLFIESEETKIVFDTGPDFRQQMLANGITDLDAVIFTHNHKDHTAGLDDIRPINYLHKKLIEVYAEEYVQRTLKMEYSYIFNEKDYPGIPQLNLHTITDSAFNVRDIALQPIRVWHKDLPVLGFRIGNFTYITDANRIDAEEFDKIRGTEILVINALQHKPHYSHFTLQEALDIIAEIQPKKAYLTHISHKMGCYEEVQAMLPEGVFVAWDGLQIEVN